MREGGVPGGSDIDTHPLCVEWMRVLLLLGGLVSLLPTLERMTPLPSSFCFKTLAGPHSLSTGCVGCAVTPGQSDLDCKWTALI